MRAAGRGQRLICAWALLGALVAGAGCQTYEQRLQDFRRYYGSADFPAAEAAVDRLLVEDCGLPAEKVSSPEPIAAGAVNIEKGDAHLFVLEKSMARLGRREPDAAIDLLRAARDTLDKYLVKGVDQYISSKVTDDTAMTYAGADYEHIMVRVLLALFDLVDNKGQDAYAYVLQIGEKQEEIIGSPFGEAEGYKPREKYRRVAVGAYMEGLKREADLAAGEAAKAYERAVEYSGDLASDGIFQAALARAKSGKLAEPGNGIIHVFYLAGRGPYLGQTKGTITPQSTQLAGAAIATLSLGITAASLGQAPVPIPEVRVSDRSPAPLDVRVEGLEGPAGSARTQSILDVNEVALQQLEANLPWIITRAIIRRTIKAGVATGAGIGAGIAARQTVGSGFSSFAGVTTGLGLNLASTATERADTRNWSSLPAQIQAARLEAPEGEHTLNLGPGMSPRVRLRKGYNTYVVVLRPNLAAPGVVLVDQYSRPLSQASPESPASPTPPTSPAAAPVPTQAAAAPSGA